MGILDEALSHAPKYPKPFRQSGRVVAVKSKDLEEYGVTQTVYTIADPKQQTQDGQDFKPIKSKDGTWSVSVKALETRKDKETGGSKIVLAKGYQAHLESLATALGKPVLGFIKDTKKGANDAEIKGPADLEDRLLNAEVTFIQHVYPSVDSKTGLRAVNPITGEEYADTIVYDFEEVRLPAKKASAAVTTVAGKSKIAARR